MYIRVAASRVGSVPAWVDLAAAKAIPRDVEVGLSKTYVGRFVEHTASAAAWFAAIVARVVLAVVVVDLVAVSFSLAAAWMALSTTKVSLVVVEVVLVVARVLE